MIGKLLLLGVLMIFIIGPTSAARLPNQTPENQVFGVDTVLDATGMIEDDTVMSWAIASPGAIPTGILGPGQSISLLDYSDHIRTNGGKISGNKVFKFISQDRADPLNNLETEKLLTYESVEGAHLEGEELLSLDVAGNFSQTSDNVRCVFMTTPHSIIPAFCTKVTAKSSLLSLNTGQVSTKGNARAVVRSISDPLALSYRIAITPDSNSENGFADGTVKTFLSVGIMEARDNGTNTWNKTSSTYTWTDATTVTGGIKNFQKDFGDPSGFQAGFFSPIGDNGYRAPQTTGTIIVSLAGIQDTHYNSIGPFTLTGPNGWSTTGTVNPGSSVSFPDMPPGMYTATLGGLILTHDLQPGETYNFHFTLT